MAPEVVDIEASFPLQKLAKTFSLTQQLGLAGGVGEGLEELGVGPVGTSRRRSRDSAERKIRVVQNSGSSLASQETNR